jgi:hypothetical protein
MGLNMYGAQHQSIWLISLLLALIMVAGIGIVAILSFDAAVALRGIGVAVGTCLVVYTLAVGYQLTQVRADDPAEAYVTEASVSGLRTLVNTIETTSTRAYSDPNTLPLQVMDSAPPALRWALHDQRNVKYVPQVRDSAAALTPISAKPGGSQVYIGNAFRVTAQASLAGLRCQLAVGAQPGAPEQLDCTTLARWLISRDVGERSVTRWIFWLREDTALKASGQR